MVIETSTRYVMGLESIRMYGLANKLTRLRMDIVIQSVKDDDPQRLSELIEELTGYENIARQMIDAKSQKKQSH